MAVCPQCGTENSPAASTCHACGAALGRAKGFAGTMVGMPSPFAPEKKPTESAPDTPRAATPEAASADALPPPAPEPERAGASSPKRAPLGGTMIGMPSPFASPAKSDPSSLPNATAPQATPAPVADTGQARRPNLSGTMIGMPSPFAAGAPPPAVSPSAGPRGPEANAPSPLAPVQPSSSAPPGGDPMGRTMVGTGQPPHTPDTGAKNPRFAGTLLGVAQPGIAPSAPKELAAAAPPAPAVDAPPPDSISAAGPSSDRIAPRRFSSRPARKRLPTTRSPLRTLGFIGGGMLVAGAIGGLVAVLAPKPVVVMVSEFSIDQEGNDRLKLRCAGCEDGDTLILGKAKAVVQGSEAALTPEKPLALGRNELSFRLLTKAGENKEAKPVVLPVAFRVLTSWSGRHASPPTAQVTVAAPSGTEVVISESKVAVTGEKAIHEVVFDEETRGESKTITSVSSKIPVRVVVDGKPRTASAELKSGVTPLTLTTPALFHRLKGEPVTVEGTTAPKARVKVGSQEVIADDKGHFSAVVSAPGEGELLVQASGESLLARRVSVTLSKTIRPPASAKTKFGDFAPGVEVVVRGTVVESRISAGTTRALLEIETGCEAAPCLLRAVYGEPVKLRPNRPITVIGTAQGGSPLTIRASSLQ